MDNEHDPLVAGADRIRETAKWLTVSVAALGAILIAGTQFSSIGSLSPSSPRFVPAVGGGLLAAMGTFVVLWGAVWTATTTPVRLMTLASGTPELDDLALLQGPSSVEDLREEYQEAVTTRQSAIAANMKIPTPDTRQESEAADIQVQYLAGIVQNVLQVASYYKLARTWRKASWMVGIGSAVAATGLLLFIWAANPPAATLKSMAGPTVVGDTPVQTMTLSETGQRLLQAILGENCSVAEPMAVLLLDTTESGADVVVQQQDCRSIRLLVTPDWGLVRDGT